MGIANSKAGLQRRAVRAHEWTKAKRAVFLEVLGATCNVSAAARAAGMSTTNAQLLKKRDGEFADLWRQAFEAGRERLHEELIAHALGQMPTGDNPDGDATAVEQPRVPFDPERAIAVLKLQGGFDGGRGRRRAAAPTPGQVDAALMARLEQLAARTAGR